jgi:hypothetical protein
MRREGAGIVLATTILLSGIAATAADAPPSPRPPAPTVTLGPGWQEQDRQYLTDDTPTEQLFAAYVKGFGLLFLSRTTMTKTVAETQGQERTRARLLQARVIADDTRRVCKGTQDAWLLEYIRPGTNGPVDFIQIHVFEPNGDYSEHYQGLLTVNRDPEIDNMLLSFCAPKPK